MRFNNFTVYSEDNNELMINLVNGSADSSIATIKKALESLGFSTDLFTYHIVTDADLDYKIE